jgi:hypothetical protein
MTLVTAAVQSSGALTYISISMFSQALQLETVQESLLVGVTLAGVHAGAHLGLGVALTPCKPNQLSRARHQLRFVSPALPSRRVHLPSQKFPALSSNSSPPHRIAHRVSSQHWPSRRRPGKRDKPLPLGTLHTREERYYPTTGLIPRPRAYQTDPNQNQTRPNQPTEPCLALPNRKRTLHPHQHQQTISRRRQQ